MPSGITRIIAADFGERLKNRERNLVAAAFDFLAVSMLAAALGDQEWFYLNGGKCQLKYLGTSLFYKIGSFRTELRTDPGDAVPKEHLYYLTGHHSKKITKIIWSIYRLSPKFDCHFFCFMDETLQPLFLAFYFRYLFFYLLQSMWIV